MAKSLTKVFKEGVFADQVTRRAADDTYLFRRTFFYRSGGTPEKFAAAMIAEIQELGYDARVVEAGEHWAAFKGGSSVAASSHWFARMEIV